MSILKKIKPSIEKRGLLLVAGLVWTFAGCILLYKGFIGLYINGQYFNAEITAGLILGILFFKFFFSKVSIKHINRIFSLKIERPCLFSFFNLQGYLMMCIMITTGISLRRLDIINHQLLFTFYIVMGTPLLASAIRFYYSWFKYAQIQKQYNSENNQFTPEQPS